MFTLRFFIITLSIWLVCAPTVYILIRRDFRRDAGKWTQLDRVSWGFFSVIMAPFLLFIVVVGDLVAKISTSAWAKRGARW